MATNEFERALHRAEKALRDAEMQSTLWADDIRQAAEERLGIPAGDLRALEDPTYDRALSLYPRLMRLLEQVTAVTAEYHAVVKESR